MSHAWLSLSKWWGGVQLHSFYLPHCVLVILAYKPCLSSCLPSLCSILSKRNSPQLPGKLCSPCWGLLLSYCLCVSVFFLSTFRKFRCGAVFTCKDVRPVCWRMSCSSCLKYSRVNRLSLFVWRCSPKGCGTCSHPMVHNGHHLCCTCCTVSARAFHIWFCFVAFLPAESWMERLWSADVWHTSQWALYPVIRSRPFVVCSISKSVRHTTSSFAHELTMHTINWLPGSAWGWNILDGLEICCKLCSAFW